MVPRAMTTALATMGFLHRKLLNKSIQVIVVVKKPCIPDHCDPDLTTRPPPMPLPPPPPTIASKQSLSPFLITMFCGLAVSFILFCYLRCATRYMRRQRSHNNTDHETHDGDFVNEDLGPVIHHPIWLINTIGLDQSQIESIHVFKYKRDEKLIEGTDCSVCLSEFEEDESLRLLPKCSHAFHVPCIDTWLRSHKNCPLCRAPIIKNANDQTHEHVISESNLIESSSTSEETETPVNDSETIDDHHVVEVENDGEIGKSSGVVDETSGRVRVHTDLADHNHVQGEELVTMRRSCSSNQLVMLKKPSSMPKSEHKLKGSSSNVPIRHKVMKSSSFGHSRRKASSFTSKCRPHNQSY
ncbi:hypothetical protein L1987_37127 [Smallanthus sonchifolius]|uniref:Uncharacterized protein n=1 Tax=Smallanthus sonchifolius TaxID=185202 RepID=A0ACB9HH97_9ASTR|nr:hypothetical protein L1987_37127 [Smallanthus sonchifolius]